MSIKTLGIIGCKQSKQSYACSVREMYQPSTLFQEQIKFAEAYYDNWAVLSCKYGIIFPDTIIEPYDLCMVKGQHINPANIMDKSMVSDWIDLVKQTDLSQYSKIDLHLSLPYYKPIAHLKLGTHIKQPTTIAIGIIKYREALQNMDLSIITSKHISNSPEVKRTYVHPIHGSVYGYARDVVKAFPDLGLNETNLTKIEKYNLDGTKNRLYCKSSKGWKVEV